MRILVTIALISILFYLVFFSDFFISKTNSLNENLILKQENQDLRAQLEKYSIPELNRGIKNNILKTKIFSSYPYNIKNQLTVDAGEEKGVKNLAPVLLGENLLIGQIRKVFKYYSLVQTVFDPNFTLSVRIGEKEIDGLFQGGPEPKIILIEKSKPVSVGDFVYSADSRFPYGVKIGDVSEVKENAAGVLKEAIVKVPFNTNEVRDLNILVDF